MDTLHPTVRKAWGSVAVAAMATAALLGLALAAPAAAATSPDPLTGTFVLDVGYDHAARQQVITAQPSGLTMTTQQTFISGGSPAVGKPFWVFDRTSVDQADTSAANCAVPAGTVVMGQFRYTSTDSAGVRHYTGIGLKGVSAVDSPHNCSLAGLAGPLYVTLSRHGDTADKDGPYNLLCWNEEGPTVNSCGAAMVRLAGTWSAATTTPATTTATPATPTTSATGATPRVAQPIRGRVPWSTRWYRDPKFADDHVAPEIKARLSTGTRGAPFFLDYTSYDNRGFAGETYRIYRGTRLVKAWAVMAGERDGRLQRAPATLPASVSGALTFCVGGADLNGNRSAWSCAPLTIA